MSRGRRGGRARTTAAKAAAVSDAQTILGTIADANANKLPDVDVYYMLYRKNPFVRAVVDTIANATSQEDFQVMPVTGDDADKLADDPRVNDLKRFFDVAFPGTTKRAAMIALSADLETSGWGYWRKKRVGKLLVGLERIDPRLMKPKFNDARTEIISWIRRQDSEVAAIRSTGTEEIPAEDIVFFKFPGGDQLLGAGSKLEALDLTLAIDIAMRKQRNAGFANGAPVGTVLVNKTAMEEQVRAATKQIRNRRGSERAYEPLVLTGDWDVKQTQKTGSQDVDFVKGTGISLQEVCMAYSFPPGKLQFSEGALGSSGKSEDDDTFQEECVLPLEELIYETMTLEILRKDFKGSYDELVLVPRRRNALKLGLIDVAVKLVKCGGTGNEARDLLRLPKLEDPDMDKPRFDAHTGQTASDDLDATAAPVQPNAPGGDAGDAAVVAGNEVGQTAAKGKRSRWY